MTPRGIFTPAGPRPAKPATADILAACRGLSPAPRRAAVCDPAVAEALRASAAGGQPSLFGIPVHVARTPGERLALAAALRLEGYEVTVYEAGPGGLPAKPAGG